MKAYLQATAFYLPETVLSNNELNQLYPEWSVEKIAEKTGIVNRHIAGKDEYVSDMAIAAAKRLFETHPGAAENIDFVILCTQSPDYMLPTTACIIQEKLGISTKAGALDFNLGCSGYIYGLAIAKGLIAANIAKKILLLTADTYTKYIHEMDKSNKTIFGDAATATIVANEGIAEIGEFELGSDGKGAENLIVKEGGSKAPVLTFQEETDQYGNVHSSSCLYMNGPEIFTFTSRAVPGLVNETMVKNRLDMEHTDLFIFHQANLYMLNHLRKKIKIPDEKFFVYIENTGNTVSSTIPIALAKAIEYGQIKEGNKVLLAGFGVGYSWGGTVLHFQ
ncbi:ketoacyl-ACP synthase III [Chitinophaga sp.]|uniref:3-oxoacyl-ACP synthase III family protein n=1 Tax=Chitinophaga sp. TaxID=1869181 RepID=UPI0031D53DF5